MEKSKGVAYCDGNYVPVDKATIPILDPAFTKSDVVFDAVSVWNNQFFRLEDHLARFRASCEYVRMNLPLSENEIKDIGPISSLTNLRYLYLSGNVIEDISPIQNLNGLRVLFLRDNQIKDITPISSLENIGVIYLRNNSIEDISPLVENDSLTEVWIWLEGNPLSDISISRDIQILQRRDVQVSYTPRK